LLNEHKLIYQITDVNVEAEPDHDPDSKSTSNLPLSELPETVRSNANNLNDFGYFIYIFIYCRIF
jgi:hypothetical protein